ncbi:LysM peptidoglycan-binding domain-containing protein [Macrococcus equipercicus]|uniref:LysM peptidoglycan-binding domain-containing protein n=1 Tax=Macrococcus equipercicus TaxID=69967 RepID=A0ABQ6RA71_9STAP|nr:LysM peptidoglycan-binding domain-containing protein [Macrococcus equipercicus]KAA1040172.1 LysM peptidoglycan-binding domain-containing protein [Macrococcus equipercicus]
MSKDDFRDEFEKSRQPIERQEDVTEEPTVTSDAQADDTQGFLKRGVSRKNRSAERRRRVEQNEDEPAEERGRDKRRKRNAAAGEADQTISRTTFVAGAGSTAEQSAEADAVEPTPVEPVAAEHESDEADEHKPASKLIPLLAALLILIPIILLIGMYINKQINGPKQDQVAVTQNKEQSTEDKAATKSKAETTDTAQEPATTEAVTTEAPMTEAATEEVTTEAPMTEAPTTEAPMTEEVTTEVPTTETPMTEAATEEVTTEAPTTEVPTTETPASEKVTTEDSHHTVAATHVVGANENLYRIAIKYYGSGTPANVEKIRRANGISGNAIGAGQTLVIPE